MSRSGRVWLGIAGVVVVLAILVGVAGLLLPRAQTAQPGTTSTGTPAPPPTNAPVSGDDCDGESSDSTELPTDLRWEASQGVTWPVSDTLGPTAMNDGFPVCFAHSPVGAALAAVTTMYATVDRDPVAVGEFYVVDSPGKEAAIAAAQAGGGDTSLQQQLADFGVTLVGYAVDAYTPDRADIRVVFSVPDSPTGFRTVPRIMVWTDGDWRVQLLDSGSAGESTDAVAGQFVEWTR